MAPRQVRGVFSCAPPKFYGWTHYGYWTMDGRLISTVIS